MRLVNDAKILEGLANELYPYAQQYYGHEYESVIDCTLQNSVLCNWHDEPLDEIIDMVVGKKRGNEAFKILYDSIDRKGLYLYNPKPFQSEHIIIVKTGKNENINKNVLTHELYGHAVCSTINPFVNSIDGLGLCQRNGINIFNCKNGNDINLSANEGLIQFMAECILKLQNPNYKVPAGLNVYYHPTIVAEQLFKYIGADKMKRLLVKYEGNINYLFDHDDRTKWDLLEKELEKPNPNIDEYIDQFIKRYKYKYS